MFIIFLLKAERHDNKLSLFISLLHFIKTPLKPCIDTLGDHSQHWGGGGGGVEAPLDKFCRARKTAALSAAPLHDFFL